MDFCGFVRRRMNHHIRRWRWLGLGLALLGRVGAGLLWTNDRFIPGQLDANIRYESLQLIEMDSPGE